MNEDILIDQAIPELENAVQQEATDYEIKSYEQYMKYVKAMYRFERNNIAYNIGSVLVLMPLLLISKTIILGLMITRKVAEFTLFFIVFFMLYIFHAIVNIYYETCIDIYGIISLSISLSMNSTSVITSVCLGLCLFNHLRLLLGLQQYLIANILGTMNNMEVIAVGRKTYYWITQIVHNVLLLTVLILTINHESKVYKALLCSALVSQVLYYSLFPYYLKFKCTNMGLLLRYGCKDRIDFLLDTNVKTEIDELLPLESSKHICDSDYNGMCSKCPCAICYCNLDEITTLKCGHTFHLNCMKQTAIHQYNNFQKVDCPTCRANLL